jgi:hypothetical protein
MVKLLVSVAGDDYAYSPGEIVTLDEDYEARLVESGQAEPVKAPAKKRPAASKNA